MFTVSKPSLQVSHNHTFNSNQTDFSIPSSPTLERGGNFKFKFLKKIPAEDRSTNPGQVYITQLGHGGGLLGNLPVGSVVCKRGCE